MAEFEGRSAVVTGAAHGIGSEIARRMAAEGARLVLGDLNGKGLEELREELEPSGAQVFTQVEIPRTDQVAHILDK